MSLLKNKKGTALLMTILILNSVLIVALAASRIVIVGVKMSGTQERSTKAYFAAEAGGERALWEWRKNGYTFPSATTSEDVFVDTLGNNSSYDVDYASSSNVATFTCNGSFSTLKRTIEIELDFS